MTNKMSIKEAIKWVAGEMEEPCDGYCMGDCCPWYKGEEDCKFTIAFNMAIEALEKQIPKPYIEKYGTSVSWHACPTCGSEIFLTRKHCDECGQAINWKKRGKIYVWEKGEWILRSEE